MKNVRISMELPTYWKCRSTNRYLLSLENEYFNGLGHLLDMSFYWDGVDIKDVKIFFQKKPFYNNKEIMNNVFSILNGKMVFLERGDENIINAFGRIERGQPPGLFIVENNNMAETAEGNT